MIVISFSPELINDLQLLQKVPTDIFGDIITIAIDIIAAKQPSPKVLNKVTQLFGEGVDVATTERCLRGLAALLVDCGKKNIPPSQFTSALIEHLSFTDSQAQLLAQQYTTKFPQLRTALYHKASSGTNYVSFDWRLDIEVASRSAASTFTPIYLCALTTQSQGKSEQETKMLQATPTVLSMIHDELAIALGEAKTAHSRRIQKYVK